MEPLIEGTSGGETDYEDWVQPIAGLTDKYEALPFFIFYISAQYADQNDLRRGFGAALVLLILSGALLLCAHALQRSLERKWKGERP